MNTTDNEAGMLAHIDDLTDTNKFLLEALKGLLLNCPPPKGIRKDFSYILYREAATKAIRKAEGA